MRAIGRVIRAGWGAGLAGFALVVPAGSAWAQDALLCFDLGQASPQTSCFSTPCDGVYPSIQDALDAAAALPDVDTGDGPRRPFVQFCLAERADPSEVVTAPGLFIDNRGGRYGEPIGFHFENMRMCPASDSSPSTPVLEVASDGAVFMDHLVIDQDGCPSAAHPGIEIWGGGLLSLWESEIAGYAGFGVRASSLDGVAAINIDLSILRGGRGEAVGSAGELSLRHSIVEGNRLPASSAPGALVRADSLVGAQVDGDVFFGNLVEAAPFLPTALVSNPVGVARSYFIANALGPGVPVVRAGLVPLPPVAGDPPPPAEDVGIQMSVFARNRHVSSTIGLEVSGDPLGVAGSRLPQHGCSVLPDGIERVEVPWPFADGPASWGPIVQFTQELGASSQGVGLVAKSFFVENVATGGSPIEAELNGTELQLQVLHNTFSDGPDALVAVLGSPGARSAAILARNLWLPGLSPASPVMVQPGLGTLTVTMNRSPGGGRWWTDDLSADVELRGPNPSIPALGLADAGTLLAGDDCELHRALCPETRYQPCEVLLDVPWTIACPLDVAAAYLPDPSASDLGPGGWPWSTDFFAGDEPPGSSTPGATGWSCDAVHIAYDRSEVGPKEIDGDSDGYSSLTDCDNEDPDVHPSVPDYDGYSSPYCVEPEGSCYLCPSGPNPPPGDDDDFTAPQPDDDDSASASGDDDPSGGSAPVFGSDRDPTCSLRGCGVAWGGAGEALSFVGLFMIGLGCRSRRSPRRGVGRQAEWGDHPGQAARRGVLSIHGSSGCAPGPGIVGSRSRPRPSR